MWKVSNKAPAHHNVLPGGTKETIYIYIIYIQTDQ